jgi:hypothetical protein
VVESHALGSTGRHVPATGSRCRLQPAVQGSPASGVWHYPTHYPLHVQVSKRLGPVGIAKVAMKLGPRGIMKLSSHITSSMADSIRAEAARINPDQDAPQFKQVVGRVAAELNHETDGQLAGEQLSAGSGGSSSSRRFDDGRTPALALAAARVQLVLISLAGRRPSQRLHACMHPC